MKKDLRFESLCANIGADVPSVTRPLAAPLYQASVFEVDSLETVDDLYEGRKPGYFYSRDANPNVAIFERAVALLECGEDGVAFPSGMAAIGATLLALLADGDKVLASTELYGRTLQMVQEDLPRLGFSTQMVDVTNMRQVEKALIARPKLVIVESISNPLLTVADIETISRMAHDKGAKVLVDNTVASPYHMRPLELGADVVIHSATKYLNGHSDVTGGAVAASKEIIGRVRRACRVWGGTLDPFAAWLTIRGIKTLPLRMERASQNALEIAAYLSDQPKVSKVLYPGLPSHRQHRLAKRSMHNGYGAMVSFELAGEGKAASRFVKSLEMVKFAPSFGEVQTTLSHPAKTSHRPLSPEQRDAAGIKDGLIRLSCGIENSKDIIEDLKQALNKL